MVHVRDTLAAADDAPVAGFARPVFSLDAGTTVHAALKAMRETRNHLAVVVDGEARRRRRHAGRRAAPAVPAARAGDRLIPAPGCTGGWAA